MHADLLPIDERALFDFEPPPRTVSAGQVGALRRLREAKCLLDVGDDGAASFTGEGCKKELRADLGGTGYGCGDGGEGTDLGSAEGADAGRYREVVEADRKYFIGSWINLWGISLGPY